MPLKEQLQVHSGLLQITLALPESAAYWQQCLKQPEASYQTAFQEHWFGLRSERMARLLCRDLRRRYNAFAPSLKVLGRWRDMSLATRRLLCHWHVQLSDPIYRDFSGGFLPSRRRADMLTLTRQRVCEWVEDQHPGRWRSSTRTQWASKLLSTAREAGLIEGNKDPRQLVLPRVQLDALTYFLYLLKDLEIEGSIAHNPYLASVGIQGQSLDPLLARIDSISLRRQGQLLDFEWQYQDLAAWAEACL